MSYNFRQAMAIESKNKKKLKTMNPELTDESGIYFLTRVDENGIKYAYIGQAKHILTRLAQHMVGYQHIDLSIKKHGFYKDGKPFGWLVNSMKFPLSLLDEKESYYINLYAQKGYQLRNKKLGGQCEGNNAIDEYRPAKGYRDGIEQGRKNASKEISHLFDLHLTVAAKSDPPTVNQQKALEKFKDFLNYHKGDSTC